MNEITKGGSDFIGYDYKEITVSNNKSSAYRNGYCSFGWILDENIPYAKSSGQVLIKLKRDRKILNKTELTRLQQHFESCMNEICILEKIPKKTASIISIIIGIIGTAFMALSTFAITHQPPLILPCILFGIPAIIGWALPYFTYKKVLKEKTLKINPIIELKTDELYEICEKGNNLLSK